MPCPWSPYTYTRVVALHALSRAPVATTASACSTSQPRWRVGALHPHCHSYTSYKPSQSRRNAHTPLTGSALPRASSLYMPTTHRLAHGARRPPPRHATSPYTQSAPPSAPPPCATATTRCRYYRSGPSVLRASPSSRSYYQRCCRRPCRRRAIPRARRRPAPRAARRSEIPSRPTSPREPSVRPQPHRSACQPLRRRAVTARCHRRRRVLRLATSPSGDPRLPALPSFSSRCSVKR